MKSEIIVTDYHDKHVIKVYITTEKKITMDDIYLILEDKLMNIFVNMYNETIMNKSVDKFSYSSIVSNMLDKIYTLEIYINNYLFLIPIVENNVLFNLTEKIISVIF